MDRPFAISSALRLAARDPADRDGDPLLAVVTYAQIRRGVRIRFLWQTWRVQRTLRDAAGLVMNANRVQPLGREAWTLTVWRDAAALEAFSGNAVHRAAVARSRELLVRFRSKRFAVTRGELPIRWKRALSLL